MVTGAVPCNVELPAQGDRAYLDIGGGWGHRTVTKRRVGGLGMIALEKQPGLKACRKIREDQQRRGGRWLQGREPRSKTPDTYPTSLARSFWYPRYRTHLLLLVNVVRPLARTTPLLSIHDIATFRQLLTGACSLQQPGRRSPPPWRCARVPIARRPAIQRPCSIPPAPPRSTCASPIRCRRAAPS